MAALPAVHQNYNFVNANLIIRAPRITGGKMLFKVHRERLAASSTVLGGIIDAELHYGPNVSTACGIRIVDVSESNITIQAVLGFVYNHAQDSNLQNIPIHYLIPIWTSAHYFGLNSLLNASEALLIGAACNATPTQALQIYIYAKRLDRSIMKDKAWVEVKKSIFLELENSELESLSVKEIIELATHNLLRKSQEDNAKNGRASATASKKRKS